MRSHKLILNSMLPLSVMFSFSLGLGVAHSEAAQPKVRIALNWKAEPQFGGFYAAKERKLDASNGIDLEVIPGGAGIPVGQLVASGKVEFGTLTGDEVITAQAQGADLVAVYASFQDFPQGIMTHASRNFTNLSDVFSNPGTLALQSGVAYTLFLQRKFPPKKTGPKIVPYVGGIQQFLRDPTFSQQCFVTSEPIAAVKAGAKPKSFLVKESGYNPYTTVVVVRRELLQRNRPLVEAMVRVARQGWESYLKDPTAVNVAMNRANPGMDLETFKQSFEAQRPLIENAETKTHGLGVMTESRWAELSQQLVDVGIIPASAKKAPNSYFENIQKPGA